jgi:hypothetical protein
MSLANNQQHGKTTNKVEPDRQTLWAAGYSGAMTIFALQVEHPQPHIIAKMVAIFADEGTFQEPDISKLRKNS